MVRLFGFFVFAFFLLITSLSCDSSEPLVNSGAKLTLAVEDSSCTEVWLKLTTTNIPLPVTLSLEQNNTTIDTLSITSADTLLYVDGLLPKQTYSFHLSSILNPESSIKSNELTVTTMDTTSHNFTWQSWTFGDDGISSFLSDAVIIDENNIWTVGMVYLNDSTGQIDSEAYGFVKWNGFSWEISKLFWNYSKNIKLSLHPKGILNKYSDDIWLVGGDVYHWNGNELTTYRLLNYPENPNPILEDNQYLNSIASCNDFIYSAGVKGALVWFNGMVWNKIETNKDADIFDLYAAKNTLNGKDYIFFPLDFYGLPEKDDIKRLNSDGIIESLNFNLGTVYSVWTPNGFTVYSCGVGINDNKNAFWVKSDFGNDYALGEIRGNGHNDIFVVGSLGFVGHFNGTSWHRYTELSLPNGQYNSVTVKDDLVLITGESNHKAVVVVGKRI